MYLFPDRLPTLLIHQTRTGATESNEIHSPVTMNGERHRRRGGTTNGHRNLWQ